LDGDESMSQLTKKDAVDLMAYFTMISVSKMGNQTLEKHITAEQTDKMMRVVVHMFKQDEKKAEEFIVDRLKTLITKLNSFDDSECQIKNFKKGNVK
jgi:hypothetical protein